MEALSQKSLDKASCFARAAVALDETPATRGNLLSVLSALRQRSASWTTAAGMYGAASARTGKLMATGDERGVVDGLRRGHPPAAGPAVRDGRGARPDLRFSPDGRTLAVSYLDENAPGNNSGLLDLIDPRTGERRLRLRAPALPAPAPFVLCAPCSLETPATWWLR